MISVAEVMTRRVFTLRPSDTLEEARNRLREHHVRHLPVVSGRKLVGVVSQRDLLRALSNWPLGKGTVRDVMSAPVTTVRPDTALKDAIRLMIDHKFGCLPVVGLGGKVVGIVTDIDLLEFASQRVEEADRWALGAEYEADA